MASEGEIMPSFTYCKMDSASVIGTAVMIGVAGSASSMRVLFTLEGLHQYLGELFTIRRGAAENSELSEPYNCTVCLQTLSDLRSLNIYPGLSAPLPPF